MCGGRKSGPRAPSSRASRLVRVARTQRKLSVPGGSTGQSLCVTKTLLRSGWRRLFPPVPVTQCREQKDRRHAGQSASDKENAVGVNEAVPGAQAFDRSTGKSLQDLSQPGVG